MYTWPTSEDGVFSFIWNDDDYINKCYENIGLKPFFFKGILKGLFELKNGQVGLTFFSS